MIKDHRVLLRFIILGLFITIYATLHEAGHALSVLLFGGEITFFNINLFDARMSYRGVFLPWEKSVIHLAGFGLPYLLWLIFISIIPVRIGRQVLEYIKAYSAAIMATAVPWVIVPLLALFGNAPQGDDTTKFLQASSLPGLLAPILFTLLILISYLIWHRKSPGALAVFLVQDSPFRLSKKQLYALLLPLLVLVTLMAFPWVDNQVSEPEVGEDYQQLCRGDLAGREGDWELCKFWLKEPQEVKVLVQIKNLSASLFDLRLMSSDGREEPLIHAEKISGSLRKEFKFAFAPGEYRFMMKAEQIEGKVYIYLSRD
ncbi:MAG: hypothetical protein UMV23_02445 [Halanaerobium sp.]|nr:hypothetical protein [Halanaerobium sp.]